MTGMPDEHTQLLCERSRFLQQMLDDEEQGRLQPVDDYLARFPAVADFVRSEYAALSRSSPPTDRGSADGAKAEPCDVEGGSGLRSVGRYRVVGELASGGMGTVLDAVDPELDRHVVLKALQPAWSRSPKARERLRREARVLGSLDHPHLLKIIDVVEVGGATYLVMPKVAGRTLAAHLLSARSGDSVGKELLRLGGVPVGRSAALRGLLQYFLAITSALQVAHAAGVVHRDLKPDNLMVQADGSPMVVDFGLAVSTDEPGLTTAGEVLGTPLYMAPEQIEGRAVTAATDVFALGVLLYEALTLVHPFAGPGGREATFQRVLAADPLSLRRRDPLLSRDLDAVVGKALERDPLRRYPDAGAMAKDLQRVLDLEPTEARPVSGLTAAFRRLRRQPRLLAVGVCLFAMTLVAVVMFCSYLRQLDKVDRTLRVLDDDTLQPEQRLSAARAALQRSPTGGRTLLPVHPRGDTGAVEAFVWFGFRGVDELYMPGERLTHRYRLQVSDRRGRLLWSKEHEQAPTSEWCEMATEPGMSWPSQWQWDVAWLGATDASGHWTGREPNDKALSFAAPVECHTVRVPSLTDDLAGLQRALVHGLPSWVLWRSHAPWSSDAPVAPLLRLRIAAAAALGDEPLRVYYETQLAARTR